MRAKLLLSLCAASCATALVAFPLADAQDDQPRYEPLYAGIDSQGANPNVQSPDPALFFEARANWPSLGIETPRTAWEYAQRGIHRQDDLEDLQGALEDYRMSESMNPRVLIVQARLGNIELEEGIKSAAAGDDVAAVAHFDEAVEHLEHVLEELEYRQGIHFKIGEAYRRRYQITQEAQDAQRAETAYRGELKLAPNNQRTLYELAFLLNALGRSADAKTAIEAYLAQAALHGSPYPYKILKAERLASSLP